MHGRTVDRRRAPAVDRGPRRSHRAWCSTAGSPSSARTTSSSPAAATTPSSTAPGPCTKPNPKSPTSPDPDTRTGVTAPLYAWRAHAGSAVDASSGRSRRSRTSSRRARTGRGRGRGGSRRRRRRSRRGRRTRPRRSPTSTNHCRTSPVRSGGRRWRVQITVAPGAHSDGNVSIVRRMSSSEMLPNTPHASTSSAGTAPAYALVSDASPATTSTPGGAAARAASQLRGSSSTSRARTSAARG